MRSDARRSSWKQHGFLSNRPPDVFNWMKGLFGPLLLGVVADVRHQIRGKSLYLLEMRNR